MAQSAITPGAGHGPAGHGVARNARIKGDGQVGDAGDGRAGGSVEHRGPDGGAHVHGHLPRPQDARRLEGGRFAHVPHAIPQSVKDKIDTYATDGTWPRERIERVMVLTLHGYSGTQVAEIMADGATKEAICGLWSRIGFHGGSGQTGHLTGKISMKKRQPHPTCESLTDIEHVTATARPWVTRKLGECRWPFGEGADTLSCCAPVEGESIYCADHFRLAYSPRTSAKDFQRGLRRYV